MPTRRPKLFPLVPVNLTHVTTTDGLDLAGVVVEPRGRKKAALIWVHGLTSSFDSGQELMRQLSAACTKRGIGYFKFNTRGHHIADWGERHMQGAAFERFNESVRDVEAVIKLARGRGYKKMILAGHSTGANKVVYFLSRRKFPGLIGVFLAGPVSDIVAQRKDMGRRKLENTLKQATKITKHQPDHIIHMHWDGFLSAQRFVSLYTPGASEDTFPWYDPKRRWAALDKISKPIFVVFGGKDNFLDQPAKNVVDFFRHRSTSSRHFTGAVIPGASHGFHRHQKQLVKLIGQWLDKLV